MRKWSLIVVAVLLALTAGACQDNRTEEKEKSASFPGVVTEVLPTCLQVSPSAGTQEYQTAQMITVQTDDTTLYLDRTGKEIRRDTIVSGSKVCISYDAQQGISETNPAQLQAKEVVLQTAIGSDPAAASGNLETYPQPPILLVQPLQGQAMQIDATSYEWNFSTGDGEMTGVCADGMHPLDQYSQLQQLTAPSDSVVLDFTYPPSSVTVRAWTQESCQQGSAADDQAIVPAFDKACLRLESGVCCYEVTATWTTDSGAGGEARYAFVAEKENE